MGNSSMNRSSWASGSGYVPSCSIGFCVANTKNGGSSVKVSPAAVTSRSCMACSRAACVFGGVRLISSARTTFAKMGSANEAERAPARRAVFFDHFCARDVRGHEVGCELDTAELELERLGESTDQERLRQAGHTHQKRVPVGQEARQKLFDDVMLTHDPFPDLVSKLLGNLGHTLE